MHTHTDFIELVIVLEGSALHQVDEESYVIGKGDVFVVSSHTPHGFTQVKAFKLCNSMFSPSLLLQHSLDLQHSAGFHALFIIEPYLTKEHLFKSRLRLSHIDYETIYPLLEQMMQEYHTKGEGYETMLYALFMGLVVLLSRLYQLPSSPQKNELIHLAHAACDYTS